MKKQFLFIVIFVGYSAHCVGQLTSWYYRPRIGDEIVKQQIEFKDPGSSGSNCLWDFSNLTTVNEAYSLVYSSVPLLNDSTYVLGEKRFDRNSVDSEDLIVGTEHNTMYYYQLSNDSLLLLGHENPYVVLTYKRPVLTMLFPINYGASGSQSAYLSRGLYSGSVPVQTEGDIFVQSDAFGKMILPSGDTISPVLRVKTVQTIQEADALSHKIHETYKWYTKGYRYPLFETVRNMHEDGTLIFSSAFYYPPQEHFYLDMDPDNLALLDELWNEESLLSNSKSQPWEEVQPTQPLAEYVSYKIYPNPVSTQLTIGYTIKKEVPVSFELFFFDGNLVRKIKEKTYQRGDYTENFNMSGLMKGNYILRITANNEFVNEKIIKQ